MDTHWLKEASQTVQRAKSEIGEQIELDRKVSAFFPSGDYVHFHFEVKINPHGPLNKNRGSCLSLLSASLTEIF